MVRVRVRVRVRLPRLTWVLQAAGVLRDRRAEDTERQRPSARQRPEQPRPRTRRSWGEGEQSGEGEGEDERSWGEEASYCSRGEAGARANRRSWGEERGVAHTVVEVLRQRAALSGLARLVRLERHGRRHSVRVKVLEPH